MGEMHDMYGLWENGEYNPFEGDEDDIDELEAQYRAQVRAEKREKEHLRNLELAKALLEEERSKNGGDVPRPAKRPLVLSYETTWRTPEDKKFMQRVAWKRRRLAVLIRDDFTCVFCGYQGSEWYTEHLQVNHVDGNPRNHDFSNLETVCRHCHAIMHSGFWAQVSGVMDIFKHSDVSQVDIIRITRELREQGLSDEEIIKKCGLRDKVEWRQDKRFLKGKFGFISSRKGLPMD